MMSKKNTPKNHLLSYQTKIFAGFSIIIVAVIGYSYAMSITINNIQKTEERLLLANQTINHAETIVEQLASMENAQRGFLIVGREQFLEPYRNGKEIFESEISLLKNLVEDNDAQLRRLEFVESLALEWQREIAIPEIELRRKVLRNEASIDDVISITETESGKRLMETIRGLMEDFILEQNSISEISLTQSKKVTKEAFVFSVVGALIAIFIGVFVVLAVIRGVTRSLNEELASAIHARNLILESAGEGVYGIDLDGLCTFINPAAETLLGWENGELIGKDQHELLHHTKSDGTHYPRTTCPIFQAFREGKAHTIDNEVFWRKDGSSFPVEYTTTPIFEDGETIGAVVVFRDITERKSIEQQLMQSAKMATLGEMATGVAHELNQPLNVIRMAVNNIQRKSRKNVADVEYLKDKLEKIESQVERASAIIDHMRIFGRRSDLIPSALDPKKMVDNTLDLIGEQLRLSGIKVYVDSPDTCPTFLGHQVQVEQVLLNLLGNARDQLQAVEGDKRIDIGLRVHDGKIQLTIADTGGGIPEEMLPRIFEPFFTTKEVGSGTGLGLSISYGIINDMGGTIEAENAELGARFTITLPVTNEKNTAA